ncbi:sporulation membrane protein YtaF [Bacillaceae bacterium SIJ1]|uniref:sporulation membrane protein YtaF n=1 Tax=Litoribacterium kuwaitense TaxID=1398745 RepID=UPI0013EB5F71|nr:sporulation membrane protein YtaF [Litoribacterium kuwaitense]NGP45019.1 sporulation membrane protein YtaF [Litoribacterium kuwaitense]
MSSLLMIALLAFAVSLDGLAVGLSYGLRRIYIPWSSALLIATCSALIFLIAMQFGSLIALALSESLAETIGGWIFIVLGGWIVFQLYRQGGEQEEVPQLKEEDGENAWIGVMKKPSTADIDHSGSIVGIEAVFLGVALSLDAFAAGVGAALLLVPPLPISAGIALTSIICLQLGVWLGRSVRGVRWIERWRFLPGLVLIMMGLWKI